MNLYLVRHAIAEPLGGPRGPERDFDRALSAQGRERFRRAVQTLRAMEVSFERVLASPLVRARETAELLVPTLADSFETTDMLARSPGKELLALLDERSTALVGHEPWMSELLELLTASSSGAGSGVRFAKGAVAWLEGEPRVDGMWLRALWPPKTLARLSAAPPEDP